MYRIKLEETGRIAIVTIKYYSEILGITPQYLSNVFAGKLAVKETIAKGVIAIAYNITLDDEKMAQLLEKHFTKEK